MSQKGQQMIATQIRVPAEFIKYRAEKEKLYNRRGRDRNKFLMDLDCEIYEWYMIDIGEWKAHDDWRIDAVLKNVHSALPSEDTEANIDVKFIKKWYNLSNTKMLNFVKQHDVIHGYLFMEWVYEPTRPLEEGDDVACRQVRYLPYTDLANIIQISRGKWGGFYADVRGTL